MCLESVDAAPEDWGEYGWKIFYASGLSERKYFPMFQTDPTFFEETWIEDHRGEIRSLYGLVYPTGFHYFRKKEDADVWSVPDQVVRGVKVRDVIATGTQLISAGTIDKARIFGTFRRWAQVGVARRIYIIPEGGE